MTISPFDYLNTINYSKDDIMVDDVTEKAYSSFMVNRSLSYFPDTVQFANVMNQYHHIDKKLQYHFLLNIIRKRKRFSKWIKPQIESDIEVVKEYYGYGNAEARQAIPLLTEDQLGVLRAKVDRGGRSGKIK